MCLSYSALMTPVTMEIASAPQPLRLFPPLESFLLDRLIRSMESSASDTPVHCNPLSLSPKIISEKSTTKNGLVDLTGETVVMGSSLSAIMPLIHDELTINALTMSIR